MYPSARSLDLDESMEVYPQMKVGPSITIERHGNLRITFDLTDGPYIRYADTRSEAIRIIERVLPGYLTDGLRRIVGDAK